LHREQRLVYQPMRVAVVWRLWQVLNEAKRVATPAPRCTVIGLIEHGLDIQPIFFECMADLFVLSKEALAGMDVELIDVERAAMGLLRVTIDHVDGVTIDHCQQVSNQLSRVFEVENIDYKRLEVGSPGVDRPLRNEADFLRFIGERAEVKMREPALDGRRMYSGLLVLPEASGEAADAQAVDKTVFGLEFEAKKNEVQLLTFTIDDVDRAKLDPILDFKGKKR